MEETDFFDRFTKLLENTRDRYDLDTKHDALIAWFGEYCLGIDPDDVVERIIKDSHAEGIDSILIDRIDYKILFVQAKTADTFENTQKNFEENDLKLTFEGFRLLMGDYKGKITPELENLVDEFHELDSTDTYKTEILFLALKKKPTDEKFVVNFRRDFGEVDVSFYDFDELHRVYENKYLSLRASPPEKISFEVLGKIVEKDTPYKSRVFTCKGRDIAKVYNDYKDRILDQDVRYSLGIKSKVINRQILQTAGDENRSMKFWYFNNGITIVCHEITQSASEKVINLKDAQIINGAQTTCALYEAFQAGELKDNVEVLVKAIESSEKDFIQSVTLYTNFQNPIKLRDLCSNDEIQIKIKKILFDSYRYYYDRKRGEFDSEYPTPEAKRNLLGPQYKTKVVNNENAAQAFLSMYLNKPAQSKNEKGRIFLKEAAGFYNDIFNEKDDILPEKLLLSWKLLKYIELYKKAYNRDYKAAIELPKKESAEVYRCDFLLHSEYFILNILREFIVDSGINIISDRRDIINIINEIDNDVEKIKRFYVTIKDELESYISELRKDPKYYHNKFFKNETSIGLIRDFFNKKYKFVNVFE